MVIRKDEQAVMALRSLYRQYGYSQYKMSRFEEYDLYVRNKDFLISDEVITFTDHSGRLLALKPDVTLSIIKNTVDRAGAVQKVYYNENVFRVAKGTHSFKEIMQAGLECIGDLKEYEIAEVLLLAAKSLALIGENYVLDLSHMGLVAAMLSACALSEEGKGKALSFIHQKSAHELSALCEQEGLTAEAEQKLLALCRQSGDARQVLDALKPLLQTEQEWAAFEEFSALCAILAEEKIRLDFSVGNDMKYYSGVVFKGYIEGVPASVLSGGQYDKLLQKMGRKSGAIGFAVYLDLLERLNQEKADYDFDFLLLREEDADSAALVKAVEQLQKEGSVLVAEAPPEDLRFCKVLKFTKGGLQNG